MAQMVMKCAEIRGSLTTGLAILLFSVTAGCAGNEQPVRSDPSGRIDFELPGAWTEVVGRSGTRFSPPASPGVQVQVNTVDDNGRVSLDQRRDSWLDFQKENGATILLERAWPGANMPGVEYAHDGDSLAGETIFHYVLLAGDGYVVTTSLQAGPGAYDDLLPVYREIVASIRPTAESRSGG